MLNRRVVAIEGGRIVSDRANASYHVEACPARRLVAFEILG
jgi:hypothetical protein